MTNETTFVYTVSDVRNLVKETLRSAKTLLKFVDKNMITIFYTPPRSRKGLKQLSRVARVVEAENITSPFRFTTHKAGYFGEKIHLCEVDTPNVIFLDGDTIVKKNPLELLQYEFDFSARVGPWYRYFNQKIWKSMFEKIGKEPIPMPNTGFMIFKNFCHKEIKEEWLKYLNSPLPNPNPKGYNKEQYALALAISGKKIRWMTAKEHAFIAEGEEKIDTYVLHGRRKPLVRRIIQKYVPESIKARAPPKLIDLTRKAFR